MKTSKLVMAGLILLSASSAFACDSLLQSYPFECSLQDNYQGVKATLKSDFDVDAENTVAYRALRLIDQDEYDKQKFQVNFMPWKIYEPAPSTWIMWEQGAWMVDQMVADHSRRGITIDDIEALNKVLISKEMMSTLSKLKFNKPGRIRTAINFLPPGAEFKCDQNPMSEDDYQLITNYDLKDYEGNPLMKFHSAKKCKQGGYGGVIWYLGSSKVRKELQRWVDHFNTQFQKYIDGDQADQSPIEFIVDAQRWFIAIHPFGDGNGRTSRFIQDMFLKKLGLPFMPTGRISMLSTRDQYIRNSKKEIEKNVKYLNSCLVNYQKRKTNSRVRIDGHCLPMYQDIDTGERSNLKNERSAFAKVLKDALDDMGK